MQRIKERRMAMEGEPRKMKESRKRTDTSRSYQMLIKSIFLFQDDNWRIGLSENASVCRLQRTQM